MTERVFDPELLSRCISCGFCLPACPTYAATGDEASSPRGRINLMRALQNGDLDPYDPTLTEQASQCLGCRACEPVCPAGVEYGQLLEQWRDHQWKGRRRPLTARALMLVTRLREVFRVMGAVRRLPGAVLRKARRPRAPSTGNPVGVATPEASLMLGCFEQVLFPEVSRAARQLVPGIAAPTGQGCCGALHAHNGDTAAGERLAHRLGEDLPGIIVTTSGGCAAHLASVLGRDRVKEISELLAERGETDEPTTPAGEVRVDGRRARVTLQDSCHLRNGLGVWKEPRTLLGRVADYVELPSAAGCCGAAGTYALLRPRESRRILDAKIREIEAAGVDYVVAVNPGCLRQLQTGLRRARSRVKAVHMAELLTQATDDTHH
ncbi:(Fe-S)-binding protein [Streptomyces sp. NPDC017546]|uniref:(Fe-S)-binding protein n=1 Tax=unclassified Streptomyces TaxID=2593676 RepID=UPI00235DE373|nr:(Fe-S)-binding protein [Streptomyces sp. MMBL 11-1]